MPIIAVLGVFIIPLVILAIHIFVIKRGEKNKKIISKSKPSRTLAVLGSGGHTTEMLRLLTSMNETHYSPLYYIVASSDTTSINRLENRYHSGNDKELHLPHYEHIYRIPRSREVGQSYVTSIFTTLFSILSSANIVLFKSKPDLLIINGPGTCLPIVFWTYVGRNLGLFQGKIIFCESFCRVNTFSLTGKILIKFDLVDLFLVHWQELVDRYSDDYEKNSDKGFKRNMNLMLIDSFVQHDEKES
mmetsp:Transcript_2304/g.2762  ORF Transcript_2304/g.2762 Transcript_2304/m.2762 type:complete len:245 (+) Transcript_2304:72-806(+)